MALKERDMVRTVRGSGVLALSPKTGESLRVKGIYVYTDDVNDVFATLKIDKTTVGYFMVSPVYGNHLHFPMAEKSSNLLDLLRGIGLFNGYPVAEGETFFVDGVNGVNSIKSVVYDVYDAGDVKPEDECGSKSSAYLLVNYGVISKEVTGKGEYLVDVSLLPAEFPDFPFGAAVPAKTSIEIYGFLASDYCRSGADVADRLFTTSLRFVRDRVVLFDEERIGIPLYGRLVTDPNVEAIGEGNSLVGMYSDVDIKPLKLFDEPLIFDAGEELFIYHILDATGAGVSVDNMRLLVGCVMRVVRGE